ncbi:hypothetical protein C2E21_2655 [Chlorella sorokiniana]|uniref:Uncharacterized protein n=1 Tax=Chlorella sorokiniana TaxID=3076 RepID=A0A2P6TZF6_CHLSO|nr:hypothetical protein C2E21_2655 [Chlorella sorokiniana]|eukprot:PRW59433.1 hypothetical protein C2E21_2655 [Chlorella sorokiniana]
MCSSGAKFAPDAPWAEEELEDLTHLCDWLLEPGQGSAPSPQEPQQPPPRPLAATFPRVALEAAPLAPALCAKAPSAVALQPVGAPAASPFAAAFLQTPLSEPQQPVRHTRPRLSTAASAPAPSATSEHQALSWVLAMGKIAESQGVAAAPPQLACPWEAAPLPSRPPSPPSAQHVQDVQAPRPAHSSRSMDRSSSGSVAAENGSPVLCVTEEPCHSMDLLELLGAAPPQQPLDALLPPSGRGTAATYRGIGSYGKQRSAPLPQLPPCGGGYDRLPAARALQLVQQQQQQGGGAAGLQRAASGSISRKRLCTWEELPEEPSLGSRRSLPPPLPPPAWQPAAVALPPTWEQAQQASLLEASFEAQRQKLSSLLAQLQQVRVALQQETAPLAPPPPPSLQQHQPLTHAAASAPLLHQPPLPAGAAAHLSWPAAAWREPSPFFN